MNDWESYEKDVDYLLQFVTDFIGLFLPELTGWEECGSLLSHPNTVRESNGTTGFKEEREDFQICRNEEPGIIVGIL